MNKVAVCLAAYNGKHWLPEQIDSIIEQKGVATNVFISVDKSSDGTEALVAELSESDSRIILLPTGQRFGGAAANFFRLLQDIDFSDFDYVSLSDQDDIWYPDKLIRAVQAISDTGADCYSSNVTAFWSDGRTALINKAQNQCEWDFLFEAAGPGCTYVFKKTFAQQVQMRIRKIPLEEISSVGLHDWFIYAFARVSGCRWFIDDQPSMSYRQHSNNQIGANSGLEAILIRARKILDGWGISQARLIAHLVGVDEQPFCLPWRKPGRWGMIFLAVNCYRTRRKLSDKLLFGAACILLAIFGDRSDG